jgi:subfamily B ATP-binding cassette protein HlyB/CyaB
MDGESLADCQPSNSGLLAFVTLLRFLGKPADVAQLKHQFAPSGEVFTIEHILRAAKRLDIVARHEKVLPHRLEKAALPAIAVLRDGSFTILARASGDRVLLQDLATNRPAIEQRATFEERWAAELILMTTRERIQASKYDPRKAVVDDSLEQIASMRRFMSLAAGNRPIPIVRGS